MLTSLNAVRLAARHLAGGAFITLVAGCASDDLLLPRDGEPAQLRIHSGDEQSALAGDPVEHPLVVETLDRADRPVPGAVIVFAFVEPPSGAELEPANSETNEAGLASAVVTLGTPVGDQNVEARLDDPARDLKVQFKLTALQPSGGGGDDGGGGGDGGDGGDDGGGGDDDEGRGGDDEGGGGGGDDDGNGDDGENGGGGGPDDDGGNEGPGNDDDGNEGPGNGGDDDGDDDDEDEDDEDDGNGNSKGKGKGKDKGKGKGR